MDAVVEVGILFGGSAAAGCLAWLMPAWLGLTFVVVVILGGFAAMLMPQPSRGDRPIGPW